MKNSLMLKDGRICEIPENCETINDVEKWLVTKFGEDSNIEIDRMSVQFEELGKELHFTANAKGMLVSDETITAEEAIQLMNRCPWLTFYI